MNINFWSGQIGRKQIAKPVRVRRFSTGSAGNGHIYRNHKYTGRVFNSYDFMPMGNFDAIFTPNDYMDTPSTYFKIPYSRDWWIALYEFNIPIFQKKIAQYDSWRKVADKNQSYNQEQYNKFSRLHNDATTDLKRLKSEKIADQKQEVAISKAEGSFIGKLGEGLGSSIGTAVPWIIGIGLAVYLTPVFLGSFLPRTAKAATNR